MAILYNELTGTKLKSLSYEEIYDALVDLCSEIKLLTGAILYEEIDLLKLQMNVITRFIISSHRFMNLTVPELRHAFYLNSQGELAEIHKHYNRELNAEFIGGVLSDYIKYKRPIYEKLPDIMYKINPPQLPKQEVTVEEWQAWIQHDYNLYRSGDIDRIVVLSGKYYYLRKIGFITFSSKKKWHWWYSRAIEYRRKQVEDTPAMTLGRRVAKDKALQVYDIMQQKGVVPLPEHRSIIQTARYLVYLKFFEVLQSTAINNIFSDIKIEKQ